MFGISLGTYRAEVCDACGESFVDGEVMDAIEAKTKELDAWIGPRCIVGSLERDDRVAITVDDKNRDCEISENLRWTYSLELTPSTALSGQGPSPHQSLFPTR